MFSIKFCGANKEVTGSCHLVNFKNTKILVDCGLFQGFNEESNWEPFPFVPSEIDALILTHAHLDHCGRIPRLYKEGFKGKIFCTPPTEELIKLIWEDYLKINLDEHPNRLLFESDHIAGASGLIQTVEYDTLTRISQQARFTLRDAGHILGSAIIELLLQGDGAPKTIVFSGDLGNSPTPLLKSSYIAKKADYLVMESTYGDRLHEDTSARANLLKKTINRVAADKGVLLIPSFALERTQELLFDLNHLVERGAFQDVSFFVDSPMAIKATEIYKKYSSYFNQKSRLTISLGDDLFDFHNLKFTFSVPESKMINTTPAPKVIIAGSGMCNGGRILHHLSFYLPDRHTSLLFIGFQVQGTLGRALLDGLKKIVINDQALQVRSDILAIGGYSSHADQRGITNWIGKMSKKPQKIFITHGEKDPAKALAAVIADDFGIETVIPNYGKEIRLETRN